MRIVNKQEFYSLPSGTIFSEYEPCAFHDLLVKGENSYDGERPFNYAEMSLIASIECSGSDDYYDKLENHGGKSIKIDYDNFGGNGMYDDDQLYAIYEKEDLIGMMEIIQKAISLL